MVILNGYTKWLYKDLYFQFNELVEFRFGFIFFLENETQHQEGDHQRSKPICSVCKNPMKVHKNVKDCPKNK